MAMTRFGLALASSAVVGALTLAAPAAAETTVAFRAIFVERGCAPLTICGAGNVAGLGHVEQTVPSSTDADRAARFER